MISRLKFFFAKNRHFMDLVDRIDKMDFFVLLQKKVKSSIG